MMATAIFHWLKDVVEDESVGDNQIELKKPHNLPISKVRKFLQTFFERDICSPQQTAKKIICQIHLGNQKRLQSASTLTKKLVVVVELWKAAYKF